MGSRRSPDEPSLRAPGADHVAGYDAAAVAAVTARLARGRARGKLIVTIG